MGAFLQPETNASPPVVERMCDAGSSRDFLANISSRDDDDPLGIKALAASLGSHDAQPPMQSRLHAAGGAGSSKMPQSKSDAVGDSSAGEASSTASASSVDMPIPAFGKKTPFLPPLPEES